MRRTTGQGKKVRESFCPHALRLGVCWIPPEPPPRCGEHGGSPGSGSLWGYCDPPR